MIKKLRAELVDMTKRCEDANKVKLQFLIK